MDPQQLESSLEFANILHTLVEQESPMRSAADLFDELNASGRVPRIEAKRASELGQVGHADRDCIRQRARSQRRLPAPGARLVHQRQYGDTVPAGPQACRTRTRCSGIWRRGAPACSVTLRPETVRRPWMATSCWWSRARGRCHPQARLPEGHRPAPGLSGASGTDRHCVDEDLWCWVAKASPATAPIPACCPMRG